MRHIVFSIENVSRVGNDVSNKDLDFLGLRKWNFVLRLPVLGAVGGGGLFPRALTIMFHL